MPNHFGMDFINAQGDSGIQPGAPAVRPATTVETLRYTGGLTEETLKQIEEVLEQYERISVGNGVVAVSLAQALGIDVEQIKNSLVLYGEVFFTKREGQIMYLPPDQVVVHDMGNGPDMFGAQFVESESVDARFTGELGRITPGPAMLTMENIRNVVDVIQHRREENDMPNFMVREEIGIAVYNPMAAQRLAMTDPQVDTMMRENGWTKTGEPSKKTREWEERWRR